MIGRAIACVLALALSGCAGETPAPIVKVDCPQPTAEALAKPEPKPRVPRLSTDPSEAVRQLSIVIASDDAWAKNEIEKRETLIAHGVERCGWTR